MNLWILLILGGLATYLMRLSFIALFGRIAIPLWLQRSLRYVPPAVLSAIVFPELIVRQGKVDLSVGNERLIAGVVAALVAWRTRNALWTILAGMAVLYMLQFLF